MCKIVRLVLILMVLVWGARCAQATIGFKTLMLGETKVLVRISEEYGNTASIFATMLVGDRHQGEGETHCAHVAEHMVFANPAYAHDKHSLGVWVSSMANHSKSPYNGWTGQDHTQFEVTLPAEQIPEGLTRLISGLFPKEIDNSALKAEFVTRLEPELEYMTTNFPAALFNRFNCHLFEGTSTSRNIFETPVNSLTPKQVLGFMEREYSASRLIITLVGNFDEKAAIAALRQALQGKPVKPRPTSPDIVLNSKQIGWFTCEQAPNPLIMASLGINAVVEADVPLVSTLLQIVLNRLMQLEFAGSNLSLELSGILYQAGIPHLLLTYNLTEKIDKEAMGKSIHLIHQSIKDILSTLASSGPNDDEVKALLAVNNEVSSDVPSYIDKSMWDAYLRGLEEIPLGLADSRKVQDLTASELQEGLLHTAVKYMENAKYTGLLVTP